jgi:UDP-glucuronate 4-epimerase
MKILVTGSAGFIGMHLAKRLLDQEHSVTGIDSLCSGYYPTELKYERLRTLGIDPVQVSVNNYAYSYKYPGFKFMKVSIDDDLTIQAMFKKENFDLVVNLAGFANVRYSIDHPEPYVINNILGFLRLLQACKTYHIKHLVFASTSSVQGLNEQMPTSTTYNTDHPTNMYSVSKKANELMAHAYSHLFGLPATGMRFYTVYGPWGRPDMAIHKFTKSILEGRPIDVYGNGQMSRDFTYIDDVISGIDILISNPPEPNLKWDGLNPVSGISSAPFQLFFIGGNASCSLMDFIAEIEAACKRKAIFNFLPMQPGDLEHTWADISPIKERFGYEPKVTVKEGIEKFVSWYRKFYRI